MRVSLLTTSVCSSYCNLKRHKLPNVQYRLFCSLKRIEISTFSSMKCNYDKRHISSQSYLIYLLSAIGLTPGGNSTGHFFTQTIHKTTQWNRICRKYITARMHKHRCSRNVKILHLFLCIIFHFTPVARRRVMLVHSKSLRVIGIGRWHNYHATVLELSCLRGKIYPA